VLGALFMIEVKIDEKVLIVVLTSLRRLLKPVCWNIFDYSKKDLNL
jgi:hypothetical protein